MKKSVYALFLCLCAVAFFVCGCSNSGAEVNVAEKNAFRIIRQVDSSGKIGLSYIFPVNTQILEEKGCNETQIRNYRFYLSLYVGALAQQQRQRVVSGCAVGNVAYYTDVDGLGFSIIFDSVAAQNKFFGVPEAAEGEDEQKNRTKTSGIFIKKQEISTTFPVSSVEAAENLKQINSMAISAWCSTANLPQDDILSTLDSSVFIYDFATTQKSLKSEFYYDDQNFHHNVFVRTLGQIKENSTITFYTTYPNIALWYILAIALVLAGMLAAYFALKNRKPPQESKIVTKIK